MREKGVACLSRLESVVGMLGEYSLPHDFLRPWLWSGRDAQPGSVRQVVRAVGLFIYSWMSVVLSTLLTIIMNTSAYNHEHHAQHAC